MVVQFYTAKIALANESEEKKEVTSIKIDGDDQSCQIKVAMLAQHFILVLQCLLCDCRMLQNKLSKKHETFMKYLQCK